MIAVPLTGEHLLMLLAQTQVAMGFWALEQNKFAKSKELSVFVLQKSDVSPQTHRWALSAWMIADALQSTPPPGVTFGDLQRNHCNALCDLPGWKNVSLHDAQSITFVGYRNRLMSEPQFKLAGTRRPAFLQGIFQDEQQKRLPPINDPTAAQQGAREHKLEGTREGARESKFNGARANKLEGKFDSCSTLKTKLQNYDLEIELKGKKPSELFLLELANTLERSLCRASDLNLDEESFSIKQLDIFSRLARTLWQQRKNELAQKWGLLALRKAESLEDADAVHEAAAILYGQVGYETKKREELFADVSQLEKRVASFANEALRKWLNWRIALLAFEQGNYAASIQRFGALKDLSETASETAQYSFWLARSLLAQGKKENGASQLRFAGAADPLGYYDALAAQVLNQNLNLSQIYASTTRTSPFLVPYQDVLERWIRLKPNPAFALFEGSERSLTESNNEDRAFEKGLAASFLHTAALRAAMHHNSFNSFSAYLRDYDSVFTNALHSEVLWTKKTYLEGYQDNAEYKWAAVRIAWTLRALGDYQNAISLVTLFKSYLIDQEKSEDLSFLNFIFFPRPYEVEFTNAARACGVEVNLLYAVARQESFFRTKAVSPAGALGLMQLMPATARQTLHLIQPKPTSSTKEVGKGVSEQVSDDVGSQKNAKINLFEPSTNILAGACTLRRLMQKFNGELAYTLAAYNAGEASVDNWIRMRNGLDTVTFVEWIPYSETQHYVKSVIRNFSAYNWIYTLP